MLARAFAALARLVTSQAAFGEEVTYLLASGQTIVANAIVDRLPRTADLGDVGAPRNQVEISIPRTVLSDVSKGRDKVSLLWTDGVVRVARVASVAQTSNGMWRLGLSL